MIRHEPDASADDLTIPPQLTFDAEPSAGWMAFADLRAEDSPSSSSSLDSYLAQRHIWRRIPLNREAQAATRAAHAETTQDRAQLLQAAVSGSSSPITLVIRDEQDSVSEYGSVESESEEYRSALSSEDAYDGGHYDTVGSEDADSAYLMPRTVSVSNDSSGNDDDDSNETHGRDSPGHGSNSTVVSNESSPLDYGDSDTEEISLDFPGVGASSSTTHELVDTTLSAIRVPFSWRKTTPAATHQFVWYQ